MDAPACVRLAACGRCRQLLIQYVCACQGMRKGVAESAAFILFLSRGVLLRPFCQLEIREAVALQKPLVLLHEVSVHNDAVSIFIRGRWP